LKPGFVFDTGMLIALERRKQRANNFLDLARRDGMAIHVPAPVFAEWWRGKSKQREDIRESFEVDYLSEAVIRLAGEVLGKVRGAFDGCIAIDALVITSAALRGDTVLTGDIHDFARLRAFFPGVRVLGCGGEA
jgi:predicted nucleic acid-binding protein